MRRFAIIIFIIFSLSVMNSCCSTTCPTDNIDDNCDNPIDCIEWISIPAGEYTSGAQNTIQSIDYDYFIMKTEVTNQQYIQFLNEAYQLDLISIGFLGDIFGYYEGDSLCQEDSTYRYTFTVETDTVSRINFEDNIFSVDSIYFNHPVEWISWFGAYAFCKFYGFELPLEQEWEKAARGNTGWRFPWGNNEDLRRNNIWDSGDPYDNGTTPIGFYNGEVNSGYSTNDDTSPYGLHDLMGNVIEWTRSIDYETGFRTQKGMSWLANWFPECWISFGVNYHGNLGSGEGFRCVKYY